MKRLWVGMSILLLSACSTSGGFQKKMDNYMGRPIEDLMTRTGYPSRQFHAPNGNTVYEFISHREMQLPQTTTTNANVQGYGNQAYGSATTTSYGGGPVSLDCVLDVETDANRTIVAWHANGNSCRG